MKTHLHIKYLFISVLLLVSTACKKEFKTNTIVNFHVYNPVSGEGLGNTQVVIANYSYKDLTTVYSFV